MSSRQFGVVFPEFFVTCLNSERKAKSKALYEFENLRYSYSQNLRQSAKKEHLKLELSLKAQL